MFDNVHVKVNWGTLDWKSTFYQLVDCAIKTLYIVRFKLFLQVCLSLHSTQFDLQKKSKVKVYLL